MPDRLDRVRIATRHGDREISWAAREKLLAEIRQLESARVVVAAFEAVGASRPVVLDRDGQAILLRAIHLIAEDAGGEHHLPRDLAELRSMLIGELNATAV